MEKIHSIFMVSVLLLGILFLFGCQTKELTSAKVYIQQDDWAKAQEQLEQAVKMYPADAEAHVLLAEAYARASEWEKMATELQASLDASPKFADKVKYLRDKYWVQNFNSGVGKVKAEKYNEALSFFENCMNIDPKRVDAHKNIAFVQMRLENTDAALNYYNQVIELEPKDVKTLLQIGSLHYENKDYNKCIKYMDKVLALEPDNIEAISQKAFAFDSMGKSDEAFNAYSEALAKKPNNPDIIFNLGRLFYMKDEHDKAIEQFKKVLEITPDDYEAVLNIGNAYLSKAEEIMKPLREGNEFTPAKANKIKDAAVEEYKNAIPYLEKAVEIRPDDNSTVWTNLGVAYINAGMKEKGEAAFKRADEGQ